MFAFACEMPAKYESFWEGADACRGTKMMIFAWGLNAKALILPESKAKINLLYCLLAE